MARYYPLDMDHSVGHIVDSEHEWRAHDRACVSHSLGWRESVGRVARTRQVVALKSSSRLVLARARGREVSLVDGALRGGR